MLPFFIELKGLGWFRFAAGRWETGGAAMNQKRILVADDEPTILKLIQSRLAANNYEVITATNGQDAYEATRNTKPDLLILDILMPQMTGYDLVQKIKKDINLARIPIIIITARADMREFFDKNVCNFITKPFDPVELLHLVEESTSPSAEEREELHESFEISKNVKPGTQKIMVASVHDFIGSKIKFLLESRDYTVVTTGDSRGTISVAEKIAPDLLLIEYSEPPSKMDTKLICAALQERPQTAGIPFLVFCWEPVSMSAFKKFKASQIITYSRSTELLKKIAQCLGNRNADAA